MGINRVHEPSVLPKEFVFLDEIVPQIKQEMMYASSNHFTGIVVRGYGDWSRVGFDALRMEVCGWIKGSPSVLLLKVAEGLVAVVRIVVVSAGLLCVVLVGVPCRGDRRGDNLVPHAAAITRQQGASRNKAHVHAQPADVHQSCSRQAAAGPAGSPAAPSSLRPPPQRQG